MEIEILEEDLKYPVNSEWRRPILSRVLALILSPGFLSKLNNFK